MICHFCEQTEWKIVRRLHHQLTYLHISSVYEIFRENAKLKISYLHLVKGTGYYCGRQTEKN